MNNNQFLKLLNESNNTFNNLTGIRKLNESELPNIKLKNKKQIGIFRIIEIDGENFTLIKEKDTKYSEGYVIKGDELLTTLGFILNDDTEWWSLDAYYSKHYDETLLEKNVSYCLENFEKLMQ